MTEQEKRFENLVRYGTTYPEMYKEPETMKPADRIKNLTNTELRDLFSFMSDQDMQLINDALRAVAGDTESVTRLQRLHVSIEQPILKLLKLAEGHEVPAYVDPEARFFMPTGGFTNGKKFLEVRLTESKELEILIHYHSGKIMLDEKNLYQFEYIHNCLKDGSWQKLDMSALDSITDPEIPA